MSSQRYALAALAQLSLHPPQLPFSINLTLHYQQVSKSTTLQHTSPRRSLLSRRQSVLAHKVQPFLRRLARHVHVTFEQHHVHMSGIELRPQQATRQQTPERRLFKPLTNLYMPSGLRQFSKKKTSKRLKKRGGTDIFCTEFCESRTQGVPNKGDISLPSPRTQWPSPHRL